jgi:hypothetical protein
MEQEDVVNSAQHGAGSVPAGDSSANLSEGHNGSSGERLNDVNDKIRDHADVLCNAGDSGSQDRSASPPGGGGNDSCRKNDRNVEARERAIMKALNLIEDSNEILQLADGHPGVHLVGQSKEEARRLLNNVKACRMEFRELRIPDDDEVLITLITGGICSGCSQSRTISSTLMARGPQRPYPRRAAPLHPVSRRASRRLG